MSHRTGQCSDCVVHIQLVASRECNNTRETPRATGEITRADRRRLLDTDEPALRCSLSLGVMFGVVERPILGWRYVT